MNEKEFETMVDKKLSAVKKEFMNEFNKMYLNSLYGMNASNCPKDGTTFYFVNVFGQVVKDTWGNTIGDNQKFAIGNYFKTEKEANFEVERLKVIAELKRFTEPKDRAWDTNNMHWYIIYDYIEESIVFYFSQCDKKSRLYFLSRQEAVKAVEFVGEDRVKKYYLGVEE